MNNNTKGSHNSQALKQTSYCKVQSDTASESAQNNASQLGQMTIPKVCQRKRTKKHKLLIQLTILGCLLWVMLMLFSYLRSEHSTSTAQHITNPSTSTDLLFLADLQIMQNDMRALLLAEESDRDHKRIEPAQLKARLQDLRMHNILRKITVHRSPTFTTESQSPQALSLNAERRIEPSNIKKSLVETWEQEFLHMKN